MLERGVSLSSSGAPARGQKWRLSPALVVGFLPAFRHRESGEVRLCQFTDGRIARMHLLDSLPSHWVAERDWDGRPSALVAAIEPGYLRGDEFWRLDDLTHPGLDS